MGEYKVNIHITESCNFHCRYCFADFQKNKKIIELDKWFYIIDNLYESKLVNYINFAGGEPLLYPELSTVIKYARKKGFDCSIISNGSLFSTSFIKSNVDYLDTVGFSLDSLKTSTLKNLSRCSKQGYVFGKEEFIRTVNNINKENKDVKIKINTVVNKLNKEEDMSSLDKECYIDRWKFLKVQPFVLKDFTNESLLISDQEFDEFCRINHGIKNKVIENKLQMSYLMINPQGEFVIDDTFNEYSVVGNLLTNSFSDLFNKTPFDKTNYKKRYTL